MKRHLILLAWFFYLTTKTGPAILSRSFIGQLKCEGVSHKLDNIDGLYTTPCFETQEQRPGKCEPPDCSLWEDDGPVKDKPL
jgi:hypothetical protein